MNREQERTSNAPSDPMQATYEPLAGPATEGREMEAPTTAVEERRQAEHPQAQGSMGLEEDPTASEPM